MKILQYIKKKLAAYILSKSSGKKMIDIVEVRTKEIGLTSVKTETDIKIVNSFFLPITILSIQTDLLNRDGLKVGRMNYVQHQKIKGNSEEILTTNSEISIITSLFQALSTLLAQSIKMQSVGVAKIKFLWWTFDIPIDDYFEIHPSKLKIVKPETEEERLLRLEKEAAWKIKNKALQEKRAIEKNEKHAIRKEEILKRRHKENYIPKDKRTSVNTTEEQPVETEETPDLFEVVLDEETIHKMADEVSDKSLSEQDEIDDVSIS